MLSRTQMPIPSHQRQPDRKLEFTKCVWGVISPLLSNLYIRRFVLGWKSLGYGERLQARIVNYADDCAPRARGRAVRLAYSRATAQPMRERRPLETCLQEPVSNHLWLLWSKAMVVSTRRKRPGKTGSDEAGGS